MPRESERSDESPELAGAPESAVEPSVEHSGPVGPGRGEQEAEAPAPSAPQPRWQLRATTLAKRKIPAVLLLLALILTTAVARPTADVERCSLACNGKGITITSSSQVHKVEICCADGCWATSPQDAELSYELPPELLLSPYNCTTHCWPTSATVTEAHIRCPAKNECQLLGCWLCLSQLANPQCNPRLAATLMGILIISFLAILGCCWATIQRVHVGLWMIWSLLAAMISGPIRLFNWAAGRISGNRQRFKSAQKQKKEPEHCDAVSERRRHKSKKHAETSGANGLPIRLPS